MGTSPDHPAIAVLIPVKSFAVAKARLTDVLSPSARAALARWMAARVIDAVRPLTTFVACDDDDVAEWADSLGAHVLWGPGLGLNGAVDEGVATIAGKGFDDVIISHGDLALPGPLLDVAAMLGADTASRSPSRAPRPGRIILVPDRRHDGTNVVARPCAAALPASYGGGSFRRHLEAALDTGLPVSVRTDAHLSLDLDTRADLEHPLVRSHVAPIVAGGWIR